MLITVITDVGIPCDYAVLAELAYPLAERIALVISNNFVWLSRLTDYKYI